MKGKMPYIIFSIIFLFGLSLLLYPFISNEWNTYRQNQLIVSYENQVVAKNDAEPIDYTAQWEAARKYNEELYPSILPDSFAAAEAAEEPDGEYMSCLNLLGDGMMGYVEVPKIEIKIPIYHTVDAKVLEKAAGHLEGSSLPVGSTNAHAVISAHRGLPSAELFTDLDQIQEGDYFLLHILDDVLYYEVDQISVVEPHDTTALHAEEGEDLVTLMTCTPYGVNSHRLLVRGHRVDEVLVDTEQIASQEVQHSMHTNYLMWVLIGLGVCGVFILFLAMRERRLRRKLLENSNNEEQLEE